MSYSQRPATEYADWDRTDNWFKSFLIPADPVLDAGVANAVKNGLPDIAVSASQGKFLYLLAKTIGAKRIVEVGTLGGYSTTWLARALPDGGELIGLELNVKHAKVSEENLVNAGLGSKVKFIVGPAQASLKEIPTSPKFDLAFIDADWQLIPEYFQEAKRIVRSGGVIIVDNVVQNGEVSNFGKKKMEWAESEGVRRLVKAIQNDEEVEATVIGTVGNKGYDGFLYAIRK
ncbi:S-adenosyl-L-methionine-dependent methyltransferase [Hymenopellis radicata]|nr:S-adenosyl-L-methionine-dependent methyltransferase [Hymenopellis radicata]